MFWLPSSVTLLGAANRADTASLPSCASDDAHHYFVSISFWGGLSCHFRRCPFHRLARAPNKSLQRTVNHKVLGRGRVVPAPSRAPRARVLIGQPAAAELSR